MSGDDLTDDWALGGGNVNASERASYVPTWYTATMVPASARGPLTFDLDVEVCVIGAGLAGLTAAREIARRGWSVVLLESRRIAGQADQPCRIGARQGAVGALRDGPQIRAHDDCRGAHAGRRADRRLAQSVQGRQRRRDGGHG